jgi:hypothetical protein
VILRVLPGNLTLVGERRGRFSRAWQRERAERADAEQAETMETLGLIARLFANGPFTRPRPIRVDLSEPVEPYRGFRAGRARHRPDETGYDEPERPAARGPGNEHPWLEDLDDDPPVSGPVIGA